MFCRIRDNKKSRTFTVYLCERKRKNSDVKSKDINVGCYGYCALYSIMEQANEKHFEGVPKNLKELISLEVSGKNYNIVVSKIEEFKRKNYTTHLKLMSKDLNKKTEPERMEYEKLKEKYFIYFLADMDREYKRGYSVGKSESGFGGSRNNINIGDFSESETKLLKEAINLLTKKNHPDRGGDHEKMVEINNLREKLFK